MAIIRDGSARSSGTGVCAGPNLLCYNFCRQSRQKYTIGTDRRAPKESFKTMSSTKSKLRLMGALAALATLALAVSCTGFFVNPTPTAITVTPTTPTIVSGTSGGNTVQMSVNATFSDGSTGTTPVSWTIAPGSTGISAATISSGGLVTASTSFTTVGLMSVTATATKNSAATGQTTVTVTAACITKITLSPTSPSVNLGQPVPFIATADTCNGSVDVSSVATWLSSNTTVATIDSNGNASTLATGTTNITASSNGVVSAAVLLTVN